jgi:hypothetical protein
MYPNMIASSALNNKIYKTLISVNNEIRIDADIMIIENKVKCIFLDSFNAALKIRIATPACMP